MFAKDEQTFMLKDHSGEKWYSLEEIRAKLEQGDCRAFLMVMQYTINGIPCIGSGLTLWDAEHAPFLRNGKLVVKTCFRRLDIQPNAGDGDPLELVPVEVEIDPCDPLLWISFHQEETHGADVH